MAEVKHARSEISSLFYWDVSTECCKRNCAVTLCFRGCAFQVPVLL